MTIGSTLCSMNYCRRRPPARTAKRGSTSASRTPGTASQLSMTPLWQRMVRRAWRVEQTYQGETAMRVRTLDLVEITKNHDIVDYLHMDIQGAEYEVLSAHPEVLQRKVKRILIGTHSHEIEADLRKLFLGMAWNSQYDAPM